MGFPSAVPSFGTKNAGDVIQPAHVNDLQTEVTALASDLINGLTNKLTANAGLQAGNSTFTSRPVMPPPAAAKVFLETTVSLGSSNQSTLAFTGEEFLTNSSIHSTAANADRLTPQSTGVYLFTGQTNLSANSTGFRQLAILDSSGAAIGSQILPPSTSGSLLLQASGYKRFDALGGYATMMVGHDTGGSTFTISTGNQLTWFAMHKL